MKNATKTTKKTKPTPSAVSQPTPTPTPTPTASVPTQKFTGTMSVADYLATVKTTDKQRETLERLKDKGKLW